MAMSLLVAIRKFLMLDNEGAAETIQQVKPLTDKDRADLVRYFNEQGIEVVDASKK